MMMCIRHLRIYVYEAVFTKTLKKNVNFHQNRPLAIPHTYSRDFSKESILVMFVFLLMPFTS